MNTNHYHQPVLLHECIEQLNIQPSATYIDATFGGGGHSKAILQKLNHQGRLFVFDQDQDAEKNVPHDERITFIRENFRYIHRFVRMYKIKNVMGVLADLGISSHQIDTPQRGFSTRFNANLDMRMDNRNPTTAAHLLNTLSEKELHKLFEQYGEVINAKTLASQIINTRQKHHIKTIQEFKTAIAHLVRGNEHQYFAKIFQALRIYVNDELNALHEFLENTMNYLQPNARLCVITFHSIEDKVVKQFLKLNSTKKEDTPKSEYQITSKHILPSAQEIKQNTRARSAKLRVAQKI